MTKNFPDEEETKVTVTVALTVNSELENDIEEMLINMNYDFMHNDSVNNVKITETEIVDWQIESA